MDQASAELDITDGRRNRQSNPRGRWRGRRKGFSLPRRVNGPEVMPRFSKRLLSMDIAISFAEARLEHNKALCMLSVHPSHAVELILLGTSFLPAPSVTFAMTIDAKRYQVVHQIAAEPAPGFYVMDL